MAPDTQTVLNWLFVVGGMFGGYVLRTVSENLKELQKADTALTEKVQKIELLVAGEYVKHVDLDKLAEALFKKLDKIDIKLDTKADK